ncbi:MAG: D-alanyl-D-alanine carboxypeptidase/D-alanyl-D-alanine-endopeptidase [Bifidobacteriaceae bacterium]|nr:D-alanyl-D-alanine carboxypeptidase/D-alanyl-D-alanine-endopeptidase [Bifidobacteriaceae bacterium]MCI1978692.1 D-alanyl-D-alanine carboxypeptidase/D-alanyl-D-alanine-endopeptidase [Bifidobacteriaceae bacterium]
MAVDRQTGNGRKRRVLVVVLSAVVSLALLGGYVVADAYDIVPGYLTFREQSNDGATIPSATTALAPAEIVGDIDDSQTVDATKAKKALSAFLSAEDVGKDLSVIVADSTGKEIVSEKGTTTREPASTLKTLTALATVEKLDMDSTLDTEVYLTAADGAKATIALKGNGDMLLGEGASDAQHVNGHAGLKTLAESAAKALKQQGITTVTLQYDDSLFGTQRMPADMDEKMVSNGNFTPVSSLAIDEGKEWGSSKKPSDPDAIPTSYPSRTTKPAEETADSFAHQLEKAGITVDGDASSTTVSDSILTSDTARIATVSSAPLWKILRFTLQQSDNTLAELFGRLVALATNSENSPKGATSAILSIVKADGIDVSGIHMSDCSGLSDNSTLTATTLIEVQERYYSSAPAEALEGLPVSGFSGTALGRTFDDSVFGLARLKTGSLDTVTSMTGSVARKNGGLLFFAVIVNNPDNMWSAHVAVDDFVSALADL